MLSPVGSIVRGSADRPYCALTFDDGPDPRWTAPLLDLLAERRMHATFFLLTDRTRQHPELVERIVAGGHEIALHGDDHARLTDLPIAQVRHKIRSAKAELERATGRPVRFFRPPYGAQSAATYAIARLAGLRVVVWGPYAEDWVDGPPNEVAGRGLATLGPGDILLLHDGVEVPDGEPLPGFDRAEMFTHILDGLAARGLTGVSVSELGRLNGVRKTAWFRP